MFIFQKCNWIYLILHWSFSYLCQKTLEYITTHGRPKSTLVTRLIQGFETVAFKTNFESWPSAAAHQAENKGKVTGNNNLLSFIVCIFFYYNWMIINLLSGCMQALPTSNEMAQVYTCCVNHELSPVFLIFILILKCWCMQAVFRFLDLMIIDLTFCNYFIV